MPTHPTIRRPKTQVGEICAKHVCGEDMYMYIYIYIQAVCVKEKGKGGTDVADSYIIYRLEEILQIFQRAQKNQKNSPASAKMLFLQGL